MKHICEYTTISVHSSGEPKRYYDVCKCGACIERTINTARFDANCHSNVRKLFIECGDRCVRNSI